jgi:hypothetical protein
MSQIFYAALRAIRTMQPFQGQAVTTTKNEVVYSIPKVCKPGSKITAVHMDDESITLVSKIDVESRSPLDQFRGRGLRRKRPQHYF